MSRTLSFRLALLAVFLVVVLSWQFGGGRGRRYGSLADCLEHQASEGWVRVGHFGDTWPARVVAVREAYAEISFQLADGQPHTYSGFDGYDLRVVRLRGADRAETVVVLRSRELVGAVSDPLRR